MRVAFFLPVSVTEDKDLLPLPGSHHVDCTGEARVEGVDDPQHLDRLIDILDGRADQGLLDGPAFPGAISGRSIPTGWGHDLVARYFTIGDPQPVTECTTGCFC